MAWLHMPAPSATLNRTPIASTCYELDSETGGYTRLRSGMMLQHSMASRGVEAWISYTAGFRVSPSALPESESMRKTQGISGRSSRGSLTRPDQLSSLQKMWPSEPFGKPTMTFEEWDTESHRAPLLPPPPWVQGILGDEDSYLPTATASSYGSNRGGAGGRTGKIRYNLRRYLATPKASPSGPDYARRDRPKSGGDDLVTQLNRRARYLATPTVKGNYNKKGASSRSGDGIATQIGGPVNPDWQDWYMGFPVEWTALKPSAMLLSRRKRGKRGRS